jgi:ATP-dependent RNA helicase DHX57
LITSRRVSLDHLVLNMLSIAPEGVSERNPHKFLAKAMDPPESLAISAAINNLRSIGALEIVDEGGASLENTPDSRRDATVRLTALGRHLAGIPVDARIGKLLVYGAVFGCLDAALTMAATLSERSPFVSPRDKRVESRSARSKFAWGKSDLLLYVKAYEAWVEARTCGGGYQKEMEFCDRNFMSRKTLLVIGDVRKQLRNAILDAGFGDEEGVSENNTNLRVVKAVICASLYPNIVRVDPPDTKYHDTASGAVAKEHKAQELRLRSKTRERVFLHPESVNFDEGNFDTRWLAYYAKVQTARVFVRDSTAVSPYAILLFGGDIEVRHAQEQLAVDGWIVFSCPARVAVLVRELRRSLDGLLLAKFHHPETKIHEEGRAVSDAILRIIKLESA